MEVAAHMQGRDTAPPQPFSCLRRMTRKRERKGEKTRRRLLGSAAQVTAAGDWIETATRIIAVTLFNGRGKSEPNEKSNSDVQQDAKSCVLILQYLNMAVTKTCWGKPRWFVKRVHPEVYCKVSWKHFVLAFTSRQTWRAGVTSVYFTSKSRAMFGQKRRLNH